MATLEGGIFSRPRGKTGGIVFGAARTRTGKLVTSRLLVAPSNPNTSAQQVQRGIFSSAQAIVRQLGSSIYQTDWNRSVGQLAGFQSMQSIFMTQMASDLDLTLVNDINLGLLPQVDSLVLSSAVSATFQADWTDGQSAPATGYDAMVFICIATTAANRALTGGITVVTGAIRSDGEATQGSFIAGAEYQVYCYIQGAGTAEGLLSVAEAGSVTIAA